MVTGPENKPSIEQPKNLREHKTNGQLQKTQKVFMSLIDCLRSSASEKPAKLASL